MTLRIYADFNSGSAKPGDPCWCLRYGTSPRRPLDDFEGELGLVHGLQVILYYEDPSEEFEVDAVLEEHRRPNKWRAVADWSTLRRIR
jgi:hypothetical protein